MSYFNLRKREPEDDAETVEEEFDEAGEEREPDVEDAAEKAPTSWGGAIWCGISGPTAWIHARLDLEATIISHLFLLWAIDVGGGWIAAGIVALWLYAVLAFVPPEYKDRATAAVEQLFTRRPAPPKTGEPAPGRSLQHGPEEVYAATLEWIRNQIGDGNGIHVSQLLAHAHAHGLHRDLDVPAFRAVLEEWGFVVRQQLKVGGRNRPGIHRDDLPRQPVSAPSPGESADVTTSAEYRA